MTTKQRMLAAYRGQLPDYVPVAPEFWYYVPAKLLGMDMITFEREVAHWEALRHTFKYYGSEGWGVVGAHIPIADVSWNTEWVELGEGRLEARDTTTTPFGTLTSRRQLDPREPSWSLERPIKVFERDWPAYRYLTLRDIAAADWSSAQRALDAVGEDYLLEISVGSTFFDYLAGGREGGLEQGIFDLIEHEAFFESLHEEYLDYMRRLARAACRQTTADSLFIGCCWSCISLLSPALWRRWDKPVIRAVAEVAHEEGRLLHIHLHGKCHEILADLANCGADCICPFERPPGGDITDMHELRLALDNRVTMNGNIHTVETLIRGSADDVRREVEELFADWGSDPRRLIVGTGDQVGGDTPEENIFALIETARKCGKQ